MRNPQRGQALIEFALILPIFLLLMLGGADLLMAYSAKQNLNYVSQETAMCQVIATNPDCGNATTYAQMLAQGMGLDQTTIGASVTSTCGGTCSQITATYICAPIFPGFGFTGTINLTSVAQFTNVPRGGAGGPGSGL